MNRVKRKGKRVWRPMVLEEEVDMKLWKKFSIKPQSPEPVVPPPPVYLPVSPPLEQLEDEIQTSLCGCCFIIGGKPQYVNPEWCTMEDLVYFHENCMGVEGENCPFKIRHFHPDGRWRYEPYKSHAVSILVQHRYKRNGVLE